MLGNEIDMLSTGSMLSVRRLVESEDFVAFGQTGYGIGGKRKRQDEFADALMLPEAIAPYVANDPLARSAFDYWQNIAQIGIWYSLPPGTFKPIVTTYRDAIAEINQDPGFLEKVDRIMPDGFVPMEVDQISEIMRGLAKTSPEVMSYLHKLQESEGISH